MKRFLIVLLVSLSFCTTAFAQDSVNTDTYNDYLKNYDFSFFKDTLGDDAYSILRELGVDKFDLENITSVSMNDVANVLKELVAGSVKSPLEGALTILIFIVLSSFFQSMKVSDGSSLDGVYSTSTALIIAVVLMIKMSTAVAMSAFAIKIASDFIYAFVPVFCAIVAVSGGITTAFSTNTTVLLLSQGLSFLSSNLFVPLINCFMAIGICSSLNTKLNLSKLVSSLKRMITSAVSFCAAAFVSVLSIKTAVSARADILGIRSLRFVINNIVPVIGGTISEGLLSIQSYSSLIKSSVGVVGIIGVALVFLPSIVQIVVWRIVLSLCAVISDIFEDRAVSGVLQAFRESMLLMNVVLILSMVTTIISIGILIAARTAA